MFPGRGEGAGRDEKDCETCFIRKYKASPSKQGCDAGSGKVLKEI